LNHIIAALFVVGILFGIITATDETADLGAVQASLTELETAMAALPGEEEPAALEEALGAVSVPVGSLHGMRVPRGLSTGLDRMSHQLDLLETCLSSEDFDQSVNAIGAMQRDWSQVMLTLAPVSAEIMARPGAESTVAGVNALAALMANPPGPGDPDGLEEGLVTFDAAMDQLTDPEAGLPTEALRALDGMEHRTRVLRRALVSEILISIEDEEYRPVLTDVSGAMAALGSGHREVLAASDISQGQLLLVSLADQAREMTTVLYGRAGLSVDIAISLIGIMALWLGIMRVAEEAGIVQWLANLLRPILRLLFPGIPKDHPANGALLMSMSVNILGLDNAGTPLGIKAMQELQTLNPGKETITDNQVMLLALSTSSLNLVPFSIIGYRIAKNSAMPNDIIVPVIVATSVSSIVAIIMTVMLRRFSTDPAAKGAEAEAITAKINAELHAALEDTPVEKEEDES
jgi:spore maturation protein A